MAACGPSGGHGGEEFVDDALPEPSKVIEVQIRAHTVVDAVQIIHETAAGVRHPFPRHGGVGGDLHVFTLDADEFITGITGRFGDLVDSIRIHTNKQISPLYGGNGGHVEYVYQAPPGAEIAGFYGRAKDKVDAIGVVLRDRRENPK